MPDTDRYSLYAILCELNRREFKKKLGLFPEDLRYYVLLASSIIGSENAKRVEEIPQAVVEDGNNFVSKLLDMGSPEQDEVFREILETYLIETMRDEMKFCCPNCARFNACLDLGNLSLGVLFQQSAHGGETEELKKEIALQVAKALQCTPHIDTDSAHLLCCDFRHQYNASTIGAVFGRYADIAAALQKRFALDYKRIQQKMIGLNMEFCEKSSKCG